MLLSNILLTTDKSTRVFHPVRHVLLFK